jgi:hypothetical protein
VITLPQTIGVHPKIKHKCLYPIVLPMKNKKRPNWAGLSISWGLPVSWGCWPKNSTSWRSRNDHLVMPIIVKNDDASPKCDNFAHGDSWGESNAQQCSFVRLRTELLAWTSKMNKQRYFTFCRVRISIGWLPSARTSHAKKRDFFFKICKFIQV